MISLKNDFKQLCKFYNNDIMFLLKKWKDINGIRR